MRLLGPKPGALAKLTYIPKSGSNRARTCNTLVNSQALYLLNYTDHPAYAGKTLRIDAARANDRTRTDNLLITNQLLYQLSYAGLLPILDSNQRIQESKSCALPLGEWAKPWGALFNPAPRLLFVICILYHIIRTFCFLKQKICGFFKTRRSLDKFKPLML